MNDNKDIRIKVGIFVVLALVVAALFVFFVGSRDSVFDSKLKYRATFARVAGLRQGAQVRVAGVRVGKVQTMVFGADDRVHLGLRIDAKSASLVRAGSIATVTTKGMLGDVLVDIRVGKGAPLPPGSLIPTEEPMEFGHYLHRIGRFIEDAEATAQNVRTTTGRFSQPEVLDNIEKMIDNLSAATEAVTHGGGTMERLMKDKELGKSVKATVTNLRASTEALQGSLANLEAVSREIRSGDGTAHALIYGSEGKELVFNLARATGEIAKVLSDLRTKKGTLHDLIYEDKADNLLANLTATSANLNQITGDIRRGKGTLGLLLTDPSLYEDLKRLVGDLDRNKVLKAAVRYSIKRDETSPSVSVKESK